LFFKWGYTHGSFFPFILNLNRKDFPVEYCVGLQKTWDVCASLKTGKGIIAAQFAAQVEKAHQLQGEGSCQQKGVGCKVFTCSALKKDETSLQNAHSQ